MPLSRSVGSSGVNLATDVRLLQEALNIARTVDHLPPVKVDGIVGPETIGAIQNFQLRHHLVRDGRVDPHGPSTRELDKIIRGRVLSDMADVIMGLAKSLEANGLSLGPTVQAEVDELYRVTRGSTQGSGTQGAQPAVYYPQFQRPKFQLAFAQAAPAAGAAAAELALAALLAIIAILAMMVIIQTAPAMGRALEDLMRKLQLLLSKLIDAVEQTVESVEDHIRKNTQAGMKCSAALILFRQISKQLLDLLKAPRAVDDLSRQRLKKQLTELFQKWQVAFAELLACLAANGAPMI